MKKRAKKIKTEVQTDYGLFAVVLESEPDMGGYMITVPKVPPVITCGRNITHAKEMAREAIELTLETQTLHAAEQAGRIKFTKKASLPAHGVAFA
ncbi:hypothetical protein FJY93_00705 [Candidatus Kaiserbacteria bacterium]|nr:hypothetical protein [Candidatus Kaiserbacteria bacterium]